MSTETIADAIVARFQSAKDRGSMPLLARLFSAPPARIFGEDWEIDQPIGGNVSAVMAVALPGPNTEKRETTGGPGTGAWKRVDYPCELRFLLRSTDEDDNGEEATRMLRRFLDDVKAWIRADPNAGTNPDGSVVWQWGETITDRLEDIGWDTTAVQLPGRVITTVTEFIQI